MRLLRLVVLLALGLATASPGVAAPVYYVMRHLQKGEGQDPPLSPQGQADAVLLSRWFKSDPPKAIYVSTTRRAHETAAPLAARLRLSVKDYDPRDTPALIARVRQEKGTVLIVGHSNTVPDIVEALGGVRPKALLDSDYGGIWRVGPGGKTKMETLVP
ncbi:MAG: hypothetical protein JWO25_1028 [Alphaproteobacteria bacterium]|nr:hypothetical protein [Alphaproteobacteria bacterium]